MPTPKRDQEARVLEACVGELEKMEAESASRVLMYLVDRHSVHLSDSAVESISRHLLEVRKLLLSELEDGIKKRKVLLAEISELEKRKTAMAATDTQAGGQPTP